MNGKLSLLPRLKTSYFGFCCVWIIGIVVGVICAYCNRGFIASAMSSILVATATPVGMVTVLVIPIILCLLLSRTGMRWLLLVYLTWKGFAYGFLLGAIACSFSTSFLPVAVLYLFSDTLMIFPVSSLCRQSISGKFSYRTVSSFLVISLTIVSFDFFFVSPILQIFFR